MKSEPRWTKVESSNVNRIRYWKEKRQLDVQFNSSALDFYRYSDVSPEEFIDVLQAESIGSKISVDIKAAKGTPERISAFEQGKRKK